MILFLLFSSFFTFGSQFKTTCTYPKNLTCLEGQQCVRLSDKQDVCINKKLKDFKVVAYPFDDQVKSYCDQGNLSPKGNSHNWLNTAYAIDLKVEDKLNNQKIFAGADGVAVIFDGCKTKNDQCGAGFGNQIKILTEDNYILFYAHLSQVSVKNDEQIKKGQFIGIIGESGWTGLNNPHLHLSVHENWKTEKKDYWKAPGYLPTSVPFILEDCDKSQMNSSDILCMRTSKEYKHFCSL